MREKLSAKSTTDPILRNALRYTISAKEYETLHKYILSRSKVLKRNTPTVSQVEKYVAKPGRDDQNAAAVRAAVRVFIATAAGLKAWAIIKERVMGARRTGYVACADSNMDTRLNGTGNLVKDSSRTSTSDFQSPSPPSSSSTDFSFDSSRVSERISSRQMQSRSASETHEQASC